MGKPELPHHAADAWEGGFLSAEQRDVQSIEARGGMVVAGGSDLYLLRPGDQGWKMRPPPEDIGAVHVVCAEPRGARRYAVASQAMFALFFRSGKSDQILRLRPQTPGSLVSHMAWGGVKGPCSLWVLNTDGGLFRMKPDLSDLEELDFDPVNALASDDNGVVAMVSLLGETPRVFVTHDGIELAYRTIVPEIDPESSVDIAVAGTAVALVVDQRYVLLSRSSDAPFVRIDALDLPEGAGRSVGPIAFQGASSDAALFCGQWEGEASRIVRVDPSGAAMTILEMGATDELDPPEIAALSWDASRQTLWGASPYTGIFQSTAPSAKGRKKITLS